MQPADEGELAAPTPTVTPKEQPWKSFFPQASAKDKVEDVVTLPSSETTKPCNCSDGGDGGGNFLAA